MGTKTFWQKDWVIPAGFGLLACLILLLTNALDSYGIFRDEYYFLACSRHPALGYVDQPPLSFYLLAVSRLLSGAIDYYRGKYDLPPVICPHNSYWFWGSALFEKDIEVIIIIGGRIEDHLKSLQDVRQVAVHRCTYCIPYENNLPIFIGKTLKRALREIWATDKMFI